MKNIILSTLTMLATLSGAVICAVGAITDSFSFINKNVNLNADNSTANTLWVIGAGVSALLFLYSLGYFVNSIEKSK